MLIAGLDTLVQATVPNGASYRLVFVFALVIGVLVFKPAGLLRFRPRRGDLGLHCAGYDH